ncbi:MAG: FG-GAP-like repeat-containing protein [Cryomorphaceae bacterium]|nr:FG-GAP-like repeat-containing protein [Flavobacteriales bacterium]
MKPLYLTAICLLTTAGLSAQNTCDDAFEATPGTITVESVVGGQVPTPICAQNGIGAQRGVWYEYTAVDSVTTTVSTVLDQNQGLDTRVHIYEGPCSDRVCVAGNDDVEGSFLSTISWQSEPDVTYYIAFDDRWSSSGFDSGFDFTLVETEPIPEPVGALGFTTQPMAGWSRSLGIVDMNGDYLDDLLDVSSSSVSTMTQTQNGDYEFAIVATPPAAFPYSWSIAAGDMTGNGYNDLLYGGSVGVNFMFRDDDGEGFTEFHTTDYVFSQRSNFVDLNNDGLLDAFVCHDVQPNVYYMNDGESLEFFQGGLSEVPDGGNYGSIWVDYDNDGLVDLFIAKCRGGASLANYNQLFKNNGDGTFTEVSEDAGLYDNVQTWSSAWADFDNDGYMDVLVGASSFAQGGHKLMHNNGDGTFTDITAGSGFENLGATGIEWVAYDFNNDGYVDVMGGNGRFMMNNGDGTFNLEQFNGVTNGPVGDMNNDGFPDIATQGNIHFNNGNENNWVKINTAGTVSNANGIGARVELYTAAGKQIRDVHSGVGFRFMHTLNVHFGIGTETQVDSLVIHWPSGITDVHVYPDTNTFLLLTEGEETIGEPEEEEEEEETVSTLDADVRGFELYPNPATTELFLKSEELPVRAVIHIFDLHGRLVMQEPYSETLNISNLGHGMYIVKVISDGFVTERKFVKTL